MRLFELEDPNRVRLVAVTSQLKDEIEKQGVSEWPLDQFISYLQDQGLNLSEDDLYDMYKNPPLSSLIQNINGDKVMFRGQGGQTPENPDEQESQQVVNQMAHNAMK
jgi:hypothetical protein